MSPLAWLLRSAVLLGGALVVERLVASPHARRRVLAVGLLGSLLLPLLWLVLPSWSATVTLADPGWADLGDPVIGASASSTTAAPSSGGWSLRLPLLWAVGSVLLGLRALGGRLWLAGVVARSERAPWSLPGVRVQLTSALSMPGLAGPLPRAVLLPRDALGWSAEQRRMVLRHEQAHADAGDDWLALLAQGATVVLWPSPLVWLARRRLAVVSELCADAAVVASGASGLSVAELLASMARAQRGPAALVALGSGQLEERVAALVAARPVRWGRLRAVVGAGVMLAAVLVAGLRQAPAHSATGAGDPAVQQVVDQVVASLTARWQPRSVSVVVVDEGGAVLGRSGPIDTPVVVGSVLKPFTVLAGLQAGVPATSTWSGAALQRGDHTIADHAPRAEVGVRDVLVHSSNVGAVQLAEAAGARRLAEVHQAMGLPAVVVDEAQLPQAAMGLSVAVTPEQLARAYARLAGQSEVIDEALAGAVLRGTAGAARVEGLSVAGKTGTAVSPDGGVVASFVGWGETEGGRRVVAVVVEGPEGDGAYGGSVAAPAFSAVLGGIR